MRARPVIAVLFLFLHHAWSITPEVLEPEQVVTASIPPSGVKCYFLSLNDTIAREIVYWSQAKMFLHLEPYSGTPHMLVSVFGCPSNGFPVHYEYQSARSRNDMLAAGQTPPAEWEWVGDIESLDIELSYRNFYIEIVQYHPKVDSNSTMTELSRKLRNAGYNAQANNVDEIIYRGYFLPSDASLLHGYQDLIMPDAKFQFSAKIHDESRVPKETLNPIANTVGWSRDITKMPSADPAEYQISFWPPTRKSNTTTARRHIDFRRMRDQRQEEEPLREHDVALKKLMADGSHVRWGEVEKILREAGYHDIVQEAGDLLAHDDIIFRANPSSSMTALSSQIKLNSLDHEPSPEGVDGSILEAELKKTNEALAHLRARNIRGFEDFVRRGEEEFVEFQKSWSQRGLGERRSRRSLPNVTEPYPGGASPAAIEKAMHIVTDEELEYMIYVVDLTKIIRDRWGVVRDSIFNQYTRLIDWDQPSVFFCDDSPQGKCGIYQVITRQEFARLDVNGDGLISLSEYEAEYSIERQKYDDGFKAGWNFQIAALNHSGQGIDLSTWEEAYNGYKGIFDASLKDPLVRTYWTSLGLNQTGRPVGVTGNISAANPVIEWLTYKAFDQLPDGRLTRNLKGLDDSDNNVYILNLVVRSRVTGEQVAYKAHVLQRRSPVYMPAETTGPKQKNVIIGAATSIVGITLIFLAAIFFSRLKKKRPVVKIVHEGPDGPVLIGQVK
uniref:EF-hand domain-containing protein n=1 Tax=Hanusia phi TaxID=3032 RepID=A0A7S0HAZ9_9CRYP|mmetsp:Transcript_14429/g.33188  ORF Transcript_14429/g.33188 Transcript_14429/m.33188 type:complete len:725 (+) Transcript_14429:64-2238(+)